MGPQGRNAVIVLIVSLAMFMGTFRGDLEEASRDLPYEYFLWGALTFSLILVRDFLEPRYNGVAGDRPETRPHSQPLLVFLTIIVIVNVVVRLGTWRTWRSTQELPEFLHRYVEENNRLAIFLFVLSALLLVARGLSTEATGSVTARTNRFSGCLGSMLLLSVLAHVFELVVRNVLRYPELSSNHATVFLASLSLVMLGRDGIRSLRG